MPLKRFGYSSQFSKVATVGSMGLFWLQLRYSGLGLHTGGQHGVPVGSLAAQPPALVPTMLGSPPG